MDKGNLLLRDALRNQLGANVIIHIEVLAAHFVRQKRIRIRCFFLRSRLAARGGIKAKEFLLEMLKDGEMLSSDCEERLEADEKKKSTIKKAKKKAGVISRKQGFLWYWSLSMGDIPRE